MLNTEEIIRKFIEENNNEVEFNQHRNIWLNEFISYLKYAELNNLGCISISDLLKRLEFKLNNNGE